MTYLTLPKALYSHPAVEKVLSNSGSCILQKRLTESLLNQEKFSTSHCIVLVVRGKVEVRTNEGLCVVAEENEMLFMPRDTYLISDFIRDQDCIEVFLVFFDHELVGKFLSSKIEYQKKMSDNTPSICKLKAGDRIIKYFKSVSDIYSGVDSSNDILDLKILEFLHLAHQENKNKIVDTLYSSESLKKRRNIESIMFENYDKNLTVIDFANLSGRSLSTFNRDFKRKYGQTPRQWLIHKKMEKAGVLLSEGVNVTNCALEVGYSNVSHFIKAYKSIHGTTPKMMKKSNL